MAMNTSDEKSRQSATILILKALIPYTNQNLKLTFSPSEFFNELERTTNLSRRNFIQSFARAKKQNLITGDSSPVLTVKGKQYVQPFIARQLRGGGQLMVIFDIPEDYGRQRRQLRTLLKYLQFTQTQRSVWVSSNDHVQVLKEAIKDLKLENWVQLYESSQII